MTKLGRFLLPLLLALGCGGEGRGPLAECLSAEGDEATLAACGRAFEATASPRAAAAAAWAAQGLGRNDEALAWIEWVPREKQPAGLPSLAASLYLAQGETAAAKEAYELDLPLLAAAGDRAGEARAHYGRGFLAWRETAYGVALEHFEAGLGAAGAVRDRELLGLHLQGLQGVLSAVGDLDGAERMLERVEAWLEPGDVVRQVTVLAQRGSLLLDRKLPVLAQQVLDRASESAAAAGPSAGFEPRLLRAIHLNLVRAALDLGDPAAARRNLDLAEREVAQGERPVSLDYYAALVAAATGDRSAAVRRLRALLTEELPPDWAWLIEDELGRQLEAGGDRDGARAAYRRAIGVLEAMRRDLVADDLKAWLLESKRHPFEALFRLEAEAGRPLAALDVAERAKARSFLDAFVRSAQSDESAPLASAATRFEALRGLLPRLAAAPVVQPRPAAELLSAIGPRSVLSYFRAERDLWLLVLVGGRLQLHRIGPAAALESLIGAAVADPDAPRGPGSAWAELGRLLVPARVLPPPGEPLWIVADGALVELPFAALPVGSELLVTRHRLASLPSVNALAAALAAPVTPDPASSALVLGDPTEDLPAAAVEAREVAAQLGVRPLLGSEARRAVLAAGERSLLHVAAHTGAGAEGPWLQLADGRVTASEVLALPRAPRLTVLATCAAAHGPSRDLWGSLGAAFLAGGSRSVLASLWSLEDREARRLVAEFYAAGGATEPAAALARLQRAAALVQRPPSSWASLVIFGGVEEPGSPPSSLSRTKEES